MLPDCSKILAMCKHILKTFNDHVVHTDSNERSYDYYESGGQEMVIAYFMTGLWFEAGLIE